MNSRFRERTAFRFLRTGIGSTKAGGDLRFFAERQGEGPFSIPTKKADDFSRTSRVGNGTAYACPGSTSKEG
ncbi:MAG: hypothetical protein D6679_13215 [Candidatus Hydrogenedentota bacterium]|nr:MAG: hypothetical protein D6679_13215 [Candidatus Hydrogenedentota bacterium]